jgi:hypothetical protein
VIWLATQILAVEASLDRLLDEADARGPAGRADLAEALKLLSKVTDSRAVARDSRAAEGCGAMADRREHPRRPYERAQAHDPHGQRDVREEGMPQTAAAVPSALWRCGVRTFATAARSQPARSARVSCRGHKGSHCSAVD